MSAKVLKITREQFDSLRTSGLELQYGAVVHRVLTRCQADKEKVWEILGDDAAPDFINGPFRIYAVMVE